MQGHLCPYFIIDLFPKVNILHTALIFFKQQKSNRINDIINNYKLAIENNGDEVHIINAEIDINHNLSSYNKLIFAFDFNLLFKINIKKKIKKYIENTDIIEGKEIYTVIFKKNILANYFLHKINKILKNIGLNIQNAMLYEFDNKRLNHIKKGQKQFSY